MKHKDDYDLSEKIKILFKGMPYYVMPRYRTHYVDNDYERFSLQLLVNDLDENSVFLDIGAHYGAYTLFASKSTKCKSVSIEPVTENYQILNENVIQNHLDKRVTTHNLAISNHDGEAELNIPWASDSAGFYEHPNAETIKKQKVQMRSIDSLMKESKVDVIKIDTEGHEVNVLEGLKNTLTNNPLTRLIIELNPECLSRAGQSPESLFSAIEEHDKVIYMIDENEFTLKKLSGALSTWKDHIGPAGYANLYCIPSENERNFLMYISHSSFLDGAEKALVDQVCALRKRGILSHVILPRKGPLEEVLIDKGISHSICGDYQFWSMPKHNDNDKDKLPEINYLNVNASVSILKIAASIKPSAIVNNTIAVPWGFPASRYLGLPLIWMVHEFGDLDHNIPFTHGIYMTRQFIIEESDLVFCCSNAVKNVLVAGNNEYSNKIYNAYNLLNIKKIRNLSLENIVNPFTVKNSPIKLTIVGTVKESKGQLMAVEAIGNLKEKGIEAELLIIGTIDLKYRKLINQKLDKFKIKNQVKILGYKTNPYPYIRMSDAVLVCSTNEAFGRTTAESMIIGTAVIGSDAGGTSELIDHLKTGMLFKPKDVDDLVECILKLEKLDIDKITDSAKSSIDKLLNLEKLLDEMLLRINQISIDKKLVEYRKIMNVEFADAVNEHLKLNNKISKELDENITNNATEKEQLSSQIQVLQSQVQSKQHELDNILNSKSWKLTKGLRQSKRLIKKVKK